MTTTLPEMSIREFTKLLNEAEDAYTRHDQAAIQRINARLEQLGYTTFYRDSKVWIENLHQTGRMK